MRTLVLDAPAKINLVLRVLERRASDGLHEIDSLFLPIDLVDRVTVSLEPLGGAGGSEVGCVCPGAPELDGPGNLAARAAGAFLTAAGCRARVEISVEKRIFLAAGLGGGSSDAAAVLVALSRLLGPLPDAALRAVARGLGADVPYFLAPAPARVRGTGERIEPLPGVAALDLVLCNPGTPLSTAAVYAALGLAPGEEHPLHGRRGELALPAPPLDAERLAPLVENDLAAGAARLLPDLGAAERDLLGAGALASGMSGSGPTVFGLFRSPEEAERAARHLERSRPDLLCHRVRTAASTES
jgi:4-diphosphocytidyl-2-C-methyl-D-erythritol kinase